VARYDPEQVKQNIERLLRTPVAIDDNARPAPGDGPAPAPAPRPAAPRTSAPAAPLRTPDFPGLEVFWNGINPELYGQAGVDQPPHGTRMALFKRLFLRLLRPVAGRQATFNYQTIRALEAVARQSDALVRATMDLHGAANDMLRRSEDLAARTEQLAAEMRETLEANRLSLQGDLSSMVERSRVSLQDDLNAYVEGARRALLDDMHAADQVLHGGIQNDIRDSETRVARSLADNAASIWRGIEERSNQIRQNLEGIRQLHGRANALESEARELKARLLTATEQQAVLFERLQGGGAPAPAPAARAASAPAPARSLAHDQLEIAYLRFQRQFRGDEADLRARQVLYVDRLREHLPPHDGQPRVLDVACGDGIFVEILRSNGFEAHGVDYNDVMARVGRERGLPIVTDDAIDHLLNGPENAWHAITGFQFVEHLKPVELVELLRGVRRALVPGGIAVFETLNPHSLSAHKWFHLDLSHEHLVFPEMLRLLAETIGLRHVTHEGINPVAKWDRLEVAGTGGERANAERLNDFLFGPQDYYLIVRKPEA
jgi:O-antigen chain-terminating methyltransferase